MALVAIKDGAAEQFRAALPSCQGNLQVEYRSGAGCGRRHGIDRQAEDPSDRRRSRSPPGRRLGLGPHGRRRLGRRPDQGRRSAPDGWERIQATKHCLVLAEKLTAAGKKAEAAKIYDYLRDSRKDPHEKYIRDLAEKH